MISDNIKNTKSAKFSPKSISVGEQHKVFIETYGCQMNVSDSEVVMAILKENNYIWAEKIAEADLILINTCSIRDNAEQRIRGRLSFFRSYKRKKPGILIGVIGCMAERLKEKLLEEEKVVDLVVGPDAYRDLPKLLHIAEEGQKAINVLLSREETYADINPVRYDTNGISAFVSIMRGCNNMCAYCVVPYTRGGERSRDPHTIVNEVKQLITDGFKEVTLLGQNVDSYNWTDANNNSVNFANLLEMIALTDSKLRVRFSTSHPKDLTDDVLYTMAKYPNICKCIHLPAQSGSNRILEMMKRDYTREWYLSRIEAIKRILPDCTITTDIIAGFCSETEEDHLQTLSLMKEVEYEFAFMFAYSERPKTYAERKYTDDVPEEIKSRRLQEIIDVQRELSAELKVKDIGKTYEVLVEGVSKKKKHELSGRTTQNKIVVFPAGNAKIGDYIHVKINAATSGTLIGEIV